MATCCCTLQLDMFLKISEVAIFRLLPHAQLQACAVPMLSICDMLISLRLAKVIVYRGS